MSQYLPEKIKEQQEKLKAEMLGMYISHIIIVTYNLIIIIGLFIHRSRQAERVGECCAQSVWTFNRQFPVSARP